LAHPLAGLSAAGRHLAYTGGLWQGLTARCGARAAADKPYPWPLRPFHQQHPVRGFFGDPRNLVSNVDQGLEPGSPGQFSFHNGIDIYATPDQEVFPVVSGTARVANAQEVVVRTQDGRAFQYWHVLPLVRTGRWVTAGKTVLGTALPARGHLHLTEIRGGCAVNPLAPGHLEPYRSPTRPEVVALDAVGPDGGLLDPAQIAGPFELVVQAQDLPPLPVPPPWQDLPVTPATVKWRLTRTDGRVLVPWTFAADFAVTIPPNRDYWRVYAAGTHQNFAGRGLPGVYAFRLTPPGSELPSGRYTATVQVATTGDNRSTQRLSFRVVPSVSAG
jgi:murein DD-endopeptidase MepM/ murein hydrolase activator NlpD